MKWTCMHCRGKLISRKENILKTCNKCALASKNIIKNKDLSATDKAIELYKISVTGAPIILKDKDKAKLEKTLENKKLRMACIVKWKKEHLDLDQVLMNLEPYDLSRSTVDKIVEDWKN